MCDCRSAQPPWGGGLGSSPVRRRCLGEQVFRGLVKSPFSAQQGKKQKEAVHHGFLLWPSSLASPRGGSFPGAEKPQGWGLWGELEDIELKGRAGESLSDLSPGRAEYFVFPWYLYP